MNELFFKLGSTYYFHSSCRTTLQESVLKVSSEWMNF